MLPLLCLLVAASLAGIVHGQQNTQCSATNACKEGCCSKFGSCGFGPDFCGAGCQGSCNAVAQCGQFGNVTNCPLNVCCSQFGFCGTTTDFCTTGCQSNCANPPVPSCPTNTDASTYKRRVGYYELFGLARPCDTMQPENIPAGALTHINLAFILFDSTFKLIDQQGDIVARVSRLKARYPGLRVNIAVGGWNFNDPPTQNYFSNMASTYTNRQIFISSVVSYLQKYGLDGIDIDWEYPAALDRGGIPADTENFVLLISELKDAFLQSGNPGWEATITLPSSYWYLQNFDLQGLQKYVSWFNFMSYDLHGLWDLGNQFTGPYLLGHTNLTQIDQGFDLLWRNQIDPANVVMGFGFYGRSFTMTDPSCHGPTCTFSSAGMAGDCSATAGILIYAEIASSNGTINVETYYDPVSTVKYNVYNGNQWISYDDEQSFTDKKAYLSSHCLSGLMIWAIDQDDAQYDALTGLLGEEAMQGSLVQGGGLTDAEKGALAAEFGAYTGQDCFVTKVCTDGSSGQLGPDQVCPSGFSSVSTAHAPLQAPGYTIKGDCAKGWWRSICCPTSAMPKNCAWNGAPIRSETGCSGTCGSDQFLLNSDSYIDAKGGGQCYQGTRSLCCDNAEILNQCFWTGCQGPINQNPTCPSGTKFMTYRYDNGKDTCASLRGADSASTLAFRQAYCCPTANVPSNCSWTFGNPNAPSVTLVAYNPEKTCNPSSCSKTQVQYTTALDPPNPFKGSGSLEDAYCQAYPPPAGENPNWPYCCDPPEAYNEKWPVDPKYLWSNYYDSSGDAVDWAYVDNFGNNQHESTPSDVNGNDPYGFIMLDGPPGSLSNSFSSDFTVARRSEHIPLVKKSLITSNKTLIDTNFDHSEETTYVYCNHPRDSPKCMKIFYKGAEDTIIRLPEHVGEGPFARIVSMQMAEDDYKLPNHHVRARSIERNTNPVYKVVFDYNFHLIKRTDTVNMRVDYTNLLTYWADVTDTATRKRDAPSEHLEYHEWRSKVRSAKEEHAKLRRRQFINSTQTLPGEEGSKESGLTKKWFGVFLDWLKKMTTVQSSNVGFLNMAFKKSILLYRAFVGCARTNAQLSIYLDTEVAMDSTYAYYFSGTIVPPAITGTYAYFGLEPSVYLGLTVAGSARMQYTSQRVKLIDTLSYPGLAIKGIAAVGPTLDLYGQIIGVVQLSGQMQVGARYNFDKAEIYWPDDPDSAGYQQIKDLIGNPEPVETGIVPQFQAAVQASADLDILVTPEAHIGIKVGGSGTFGTTLVDAQVVGYVNSTLRFHAEAQAQISGSGTSASYKYGVYLLYNLGYGGFANIPFYSWNLNQRNLFVPPKSIPLYEDKGVASSNKVKRGLDGPAVIKAPRRGLLNSPSDDELLAIDGSVVEQLKNDIEKPSIQSWPESNNFSSPMEPILGLLQRRTDAMQIDSGQTPDLSLAQLFTCPKGCDSSSSTSTCPATLPDLRINCNIFKDTQASGNGQTRIIPGICTGIQNWFNLRSLSSNGLTLTWDSSQNEIRREVACPTSRNPCNSINTNYRSLFGITDSGVKGTITSCDEFPFASTEEGGSFYGSLPNNPTSVGTTCVPVWQQSLQGNCNKLLSSLSTNVAYSDDPTAPANWQSWGASNTAWLRVAPAGTAFNRLAEYPEVIPQAVGIDSATYTANRNVGYNLKRNFTFGLASPSSAGDGASWGSQALTSYTFRSAGSLSGTFTDVTTVACAVNIFGQANIYQYNNFNGYCYNPNKNNKAIAYGPFPGFSSCRVSFAGSPGPAKRSIGSFDGWEIESIEMDEDAEIVVPVPEDYKPDGPMLEMNIVRKSPQG